MRAPVIMMNGPGEFPAEFARNDGPDRPKAITEKYNVPAALHLDHGDSPAQVHACIKAGYTSVMLDYSKRPFEENVAALKDVVAIAHPLGITVEGEIGSVGRVDNISVEGPGGIDTLTQPADAARYAEQTGVDALAVSIGNAHGIYTRLPVFDFELLKKIRESVPVPLVLHGGSGTQPEYIRRAVSLGMAKINVASELCKTFKDAYAGQDVANCWLPSALATIQPALAKVVERWITLSGAAGKAG